MNSRIQQSGSIYHSKLPSIKAIKRKVMLNRKSLNSSLEKTLTLHALGTKKLEV